MKNPPGSVLVALGVFVLASMFAGCAGCESGKANEAADAQEVGAVSPSSVATTSPRNNGQEMVEDATLIITISAPIPKDADPKIWTETKRKSANKISVKGEVVNLIQLYRLLEKNGVQNAKYRDLENPKISTRSVLIRCDMAQSFDYVKVILQMLANPDVAIYKIDLATFSANQDNTFAGKKFNTDLPVDDADFALEEIEEVDSPDEEGSQDQLNNLMKSRFAAVKLVQKKNGKPGLRLTDRETGYFYDGEEIVGASNSEALETLQTKLKVHHREHPRAICKIEVGLGVPHGAVVGAIDAFHEAKFSTITFVGSHANKNMQARSKKWEDLKRKLEQSK